MANRYPLQPSQGMKRQQHIQVQPQSTEQVQKQREYLKQQQKLRFMAASSHKGNSINTDTLIENLLGNKDTFQPVDTSVPAGLFTNAAKSADAAHGQAHLDTSQPAWLSPTSPVFPPQYHQVWSLVGLPDGMVDTAKIYPLLLTSGLHTDVLGFIWGLSNRRVPGTLTEQELYVLLALVALAQSGYSFNSAGVLSLVPQPPVPNLNLGSESQLPFRQEPNLVQPVTTQHTLASSSSLPVAQSHTAMPQTSAQYEQNIFGKISEGSTFTSTTSTDQSDFDDFTDFQSASLSVSSTTFSPSHGKVSNIQKGSESKIIPKKGFEMPLTSSSNTRKLSDHCSSVEKPAIASHDAKQVSTQKFPTVAVVGGGRSIGSRLANHSLSTPKLNKNRHHKHHHHHRSVPPQPPSISVDEEFSEFQQASIESISKSISQPPSSHTYLLKESAIRVNDNHPIPKICEPARAKPFVPVPTNKENQSSNIELPTLKAPATSEMVVDDSNVLMGSEDRYSALRALSVCNEGHEVSEEEYGDFFSASVPSNDDSFADIAARDTTAAVDQVVPPWETMQAVTPEATKFEVDDWSLFMSAVASVKDGTTTASQSKVFSNSNIESVSDSERESKVDALSSQIGDINLGSFEHSTSLQTDVISAQSSVFHPQGQNVMSVFNEVSRPVACESSVGTTNENDDYNDDFGEFVSPASFCEKVSISNSDTMGSFWPEEGRESDNQSVNKLWLDEPKGMENQLWSNENGKYDQIKLGRDGMLDNPLVSNLWLEEGKAVDSQSVRSLELPGLDQAWDSVGEWRRCVQSCVSVLQFAVDTFESVTELKVLHEVLTSTEGQDYLKGLVEVWGVCERLASSYRQSGTDHKLDALLNSAESMWDSLKPHFHQAQLPMESDVAVEGGELCGICLVGGAKLEFSGHTYHPACANLWLNLVDTTGLPALHPPCA